MYVSEENETYGQFSLYGTRLQGVMVDVFIKTNIQWKMMNTATVEPRRSPL